MQGRRGLRIRAFLPVIARAHLVDVARAGGGAFLGLCLAATALQLCGAEVLLIAPFGASAVLLYAAPNSPLAQPWSVVVGNGLSALVALALAAALPASVWLGPIAVALAIAAMLLARALHPPGGAVALLVALAPDPQWSFAAVPVVLGSVVMVATAVAWSRAVGRVYPLRQPDAPSVHGTADAAPQVRGLDPEQLGEILEDYRQSANLGVADLARLIGAAEAASAARQMEDFTCKDIMSRDLVTVGPDTALATVAGLFRDRGFTALPVVGADGRFMGVIFQIDLIRRAGIDALRLHRGFAAAFARLVDRARDRPVRAADIMQVAVARATPLTPVGALLPLLADGGAEAVPIVVEGRILGIVTRSDLVSALARRLALISG